MANEAMWKDLLHWQTDIHKKDEALLRRKPVHDQALPPVRKSTEILLDNAKPVGIDALSTNTNKTSTTPSSRAEKAEAEKAKGNEYFGKKDYKNAILHYTKAIDLDPTVPVYFVNRAMAHLKTNSFLEAEKDCSRGLLLQPKNVKALWRRGIALRELGRMNEARKDFETGLTIEPSNKSLLYELKRLPAAAAAKSVDKKPTSKKPEPVEQKRRLPINVIDAAYTKSKIIEQPTSQKKDKASAITSTPTIKKADPPKKPVSTPEPVKKEETPAKKAPAQTSTITTAASTKPAPVPVKFTCPRTNFEFERDWKTYKGRGDEILYQYFQIIPPRDYPAIFKSSLESDQFEKMLDFVDTRYTKEKTPTDIYNVLWGLSRVQRIDMLIMFLDKKHQQVIQRLFDLLKSRADEIPQEVLAKLFRIYGIRS